MILAYFNQQECLTIAIFIASILIYLIWKAMHWIIYQIAYTIGKGLKDGKNEVKTENLLEGE